MSAIKSKCILHCIYANKTHLKQMMPKVFCHGFKKVGVGLFNSGSGKQFTQVTFSSEVLNFSMGKVLSSDVKEYSCC